MDRHAAMSATLVVGVILGIFAALVAGAALLAYVAGGYAIPIIAVGAGVFILCYSWWKVYTSERDR